MKKWVIGGAVLGFVAVWAFLASTMPNPAAPPAPAPVVAVIPPPPKPPEPVVLAQVVDVFDTDALLDPPPAAPDSDVIPVRFDAPFPPAIEPAPATQPIPPAVEEDDDIELAPLPADPN